MLSQTEVHPLTAFRKSVCTALNGCQDDSLCDHDHTIETECANMKENKMYCPCAWGEADDCFRCCNFD